MSTSLMDQIQQIRMNELKANAASITPEQFIERTCDGDYKSCLSWAKEVYFMDFGLSPQKRGFINQVIQILNRKLHND